MKYLKLYIAVREEVPDAMVPVLVAHTMLGAHLYFDSPIYDTWIAESFRKCVVVVSNKEFEKIKGGVIDYYEGYENTVLDAKPSCIIPLPVWNEDSPNVLKFAKLWKPK